VAGIVVRLLLGWSSAAFAGGYFQRLPRQQYSSGSEALAQGGQRSGSEANDPIAFSLQRSRSSQPQHTGALISLETQQAPPLVSPTIGRIRLLIEEGYHCRRACSCGRRPPITASSRTPPCGLADLDSMGFHITAVDPFYIKIPAVENIASGQQDSLVVRISTDAAGVTGWGESDCSPLVGLAVYVVPRSHTLISSIQYSLIGEYVGGPADVVRLHAKVLGRDLMDVQQAEHAYSGADIALWDALGKHLNRPVFELLHEQFESGPPPPPAPKRPYASVLFQDTPAQTQALAESLRRMKYSAVKFGCVQLRVTGVQVSPSPLSPRRC
jgi:hypothetical protein